jgi:hypothetical protein
MNTKSWKHKEEWTSWHEQEPHNHPSACKIWAFTAVNRKSDVFWDIKFQFVPHRKHYFYVLEPNQLMLCKIWAFTSVTKKNVFFWDIKFQFVPHRKHYFYVTESSQLMICKIWSLTAVNKKNAEE